MIQHEKRGDKQEQDKGKACGHGMALAGSGAVAKPIIGSTSHRGRKPAPSR